VIVERIIVIGGADQVHVTAIDASTVPSEHFVDALLVEESLNLVMH